MRQVVDLPRSDDIAAQFKRLEDPDEPALKVVSEEVETTSNQVILAWMAQSDPAIIPLFGASTVDQLQENLGALAIKLSVQQMARLNDASA